MLEVQTVDAHSPSMAAARRGSLLDRKLWAGPLKAADQPAEEFGRLIADQLFEEHEPRILQPSLQLEFSAAELGDDAGGVAAAMARAGVVSGRS